MGLLAPGQVGENIVIGDPVQAAFVMTHCNGTLYTGPFTTLTVQDVVNAAGTRTPDNNNSKKQFRLATILMTGIGPLDNTPADGAGAPLAPLANATLPHSAFIGGLPATISFLGLAPGFVGLGQANILVPNASSGERPLSITIGSVASNSVVVSIGTR